jgi:hypothetical protein
MITDIFARRYEDVLTFDRHAAEKIIGPTVVQAHHIFFEDVQKQFWFKDDFFQDINQKLVRELGLVALIKFIRASNQMDICSRYLTQPYEHVARPHIGKPTYEQPQPDYYCKTRLSMVELLFRKTEDRASRLPVEFGNAAAGWLNVVRRATEELNARLHQNGTGLIYNNGFLHIADDQLTAQRIAKPFWDLVADPKWATVDQEMKEALDHLDHGQRDASAHAAMALESTIKIISNEKGWTRHTETGAAHYIDNLVKDRGGRFIEVWEKDALVDLFRELRNPQHHGAGSNPRSRLLDAQQTWAIESCMSWIKSLVRRM